MPWTSTRVLAEINTPMGRSLLPHAPDLIRGRGREGHDGLRGFLRVPVGANAGRFQNLAALRLVRPDQSHHHAYRWRGRHDAAGDIITARNPPEDIDEQGAHAGLADHDREGLAHVLRAGSAPD